MREVSAQERGFWAIQVGAFNTRKLAETQVRTIGRRFAAQTRAASPVIEAGGRKLWKAQFKGFDESGARNACRALKEKRQVCMVLDLGGSQTAAASEPRVVLRTSSDRSQLAEQSIPGRIDLRR